ncbi:MAG: DUF1499 domain-containing protein [Oceanicaulis sp.]
MTRLAVPLDFRTLIPDTRPRRWLVLPDGFDAKAAPDRTSPVFAAEPAALLAAFEQTALAAPRVTAAGAHGLQRAFVQRSAVFRFPDDVIVEAVAVAGGSALCVYSRSRVGRYDFGVNEKRVRGWIEETARRLDQADGSAK